MTQCTQIFEAKQIYSRYKQPAPSALNKHKLFKGHFTQRKKKGLVTARVPFQEVYDLRYTPGSCNYLVY